MNSIVEEILIVSGLTFIWFVLFLQFESWGYGDEFITSAVAVACFCVGALYGRKMGGR